MSCPEAGVFWDFMSVFQQKRSLAQDAWFKAAMHSMQLVYSHDAVVVFKMFAMPACPKPLDANGRYHAVVRGKQRKLAWAYESRGWPWFESNVSNLRQRVSPSNRYEFREDISDLRNTAKFAPQGVPLHPDRFEQSLATKVAERVFVVSCAPSFFVFVFALYFCIPVLAPIVCFLRLLRA